MKCAGHILRESFKSGFRPCHSVFIGVGDIFRPGLFTCDHFEFKFWRAARALGRLAAHPAAHRSHANTPYSWRIPGSRQGFNVLFCFIQGVCSSLSAGVWGCWQVFAGFGGCLGVLPVSPHVVWFRHVNQGGLGCEGGR